MNDQHNSMNMSNNKLMLYPYQIKEEDSYQEQSEKS